MQNPSYLIVGAGAIGSILAGHLAKAGHRVSVLARGRRARDIQQNGLRIRGLASFNVPVVAGNYSPPCRNTSGAAIYRNRTVKKRGGAHCSHQNTGYRCVARNSPGAGCERGIIGSKWLNEKRIAQRSLRT